MCKARLLLGLILPLLISACAEPLDPDDFNQVCRPADPACAEEDYDGDGVININDDFPADPRCNKRDNSSCSACGVGCAELERCDIEVGVCIARDPERCDGLDNDGDGNIDEGVDSSAPLATNQEGVCSGSVQRCVSGAWSEPALSDIEGYELEESACDGIDSDCDGSIDEALTPPSANNQAGVCAGSLKVCRGAEGWAEPAYSEREGFESDERSCDARDNDCDGLSDEESVVAQAPLAENQAGLCEGARQVCAGSDGWVSPNLSSITGYEDAESTCDGVDSDCDGVIDEGLTAPLSDRQDGVCQGAQKVCQGTRGWVEPSYLDLVEGYEGAESVCDGVDSDCDGVVDEGLTAPLALNQDGVCSGSRKVCRGELSWVEPERTSVEGYELNETTCDGVDSDCDGSIDEGLTAPLATNQNGVCGESRKLCAGAQGWRDPVLTSISGYESSESACDGVDSDCDGVTDEDLSAPLATNQVGVCSGSRKVCGGTQGWRDPQLSAISGYEANETTCDGIDSDCDGSTDEGLTAPLASNQAGVCEGAVMTCRGVQGWRDPLLTTINGYEGTESACDGVDSDCDGAVDEGLTGPVADRQEGVCAGSRKVCNGLGGWVEPDYQTRAGYEPVELGCDGVDSDCDGRVDELLNPPLASNQDGVCSGARKVCGGEAGWLNPNYAEVSGRLEAEQSCDGVDEDCDGLVDEALTPPLATNQEGACVGALKVCTGAEGWAEPTLSSSVGYEPSESACDGVDSDCDGVVDEGLTAPLSALQDGVCAGQLKVCSGVNGWVEPAYAGVSGFEATEASCDGLDNDCDGVADEQLVGPLADRQDGVCAGARQSCGGVRGWVEPSYSAVAPGFEAEESVCDGVDSDCDGLVDERVFGLPADLQDGVCVGQVKVCQGAAFVEPDYSLILGYELTETSCDGVDSDCDGVVDEALTPPPSELQEGVCAGALQECFGGQFLEPDYSVIAGYEDNEQSCDALDNDCDGVVDEGLDFYQVSCGVGACRRLGLGQCVGGQYSESCTPGAPASTDGCDGVDNDCDGVLDEAGPPATNQVGVCAGSRQVCDLENSGSWIEPDYPSLPNAEADESLCDGLDNDCDGAVDEALVGALAPFALKQRGVCADVRRVCVSGQFIEPDYALQSPAFESVEVSCDGLDNDCDGRVDEGLTPPLADLQAGVCASQLKLCAGVDGWVEPEYELLPTYELSEQSCDLLDNDCDGSVDEAIAGVFAPLANRQLGVCQGSRKSCVNGGFAEPNYSLQRPQYEGSELSCDGLDNDCDGAVDEELVPPLSDRQAGVCVNTLKSCGGVAGWLNPDYASLLPAFEAIERTCDGSDNDCDGLVDESSTLSTSPLAARQAGVCSGARRVCVDGAYVEPEYVDQKPQYELAELSCDGLDNDCDGVVDESLVGPLASRQDGVCEALRTVCAGAQGWLEPVYADVPGFEAVESECDGVDSDCDGSVDEDLSPPLAVQQAGVCAGQVQVCAGVNGWLEPDYALISSYELAESLCDGVDSDCDGAVDEALVLPPADLQAGACNGLLKAGCGGVDGWLEPDYASVVDGYLDEDVACDGVDNDCDGAVDEGQFETCGFAACQVTTHVVSCDSGSRVDVACVPDQSFAVGEICGDGVDNDCDGETDEIEGEICGDGVDNDCDGVVDECVSCDDFLSSGYITDGVYSTSTGYDVYCNMTTRGGGWTHIGTIQSPPNSDWASWGGGYWTSSTTLNYPQNHNSDSNYKSPAWYLLPFTEMLVIQTNGGGSFVHGNGHPNQTMSDSYSVMLSYTSYSGCRLRLDTVASNGQWNTIGLGGCSDDGNENTAFQLNSSNAGGYYHNRSDCGSFRNVWGSFGSCNSDSTFGGAKIFVR